MAQFLSDGIWQRITAKVKKAPSKCYVAVPYFGRNGNKLLPLKQGSVLVVDMSLAAVKSGQTHPPSVLALMKKGVEVHSVNNLHAKIFVIGESLIIGSANVSYHSKNGLIEAGVLTTDKRLVANAKEFVEGLRGGLVTPEHAKRLAKFYRPPHWEKTNAGPQTGPQGKSQESQVRNRARGTAVVPKHSPLWLVPLERGPRSEVVEKTAAKGLPKAKKLVSSITYYEIDDFEWHGGDLLSRLKEGDLVLMVVDEDRGSPTIEAPSRVVFFEKYTEDKTEGAVVFLEHLKSQKSKRLAQVGQRTDDLAAMLRNRKRPKQVRSHVLVHRLLNLWRGSLEESLESKE